MPPQGCGGGQQTPSHRPNGAVGLNQRSDAAKPEGDGGLVLVGDNSTDDVSYCWPLGLEDARGERWVLACAGPLQQQSDYLGVGPGFPESEHEPFRGLRMRVDQIDLERLPALEGGKHPLWAPAHLMLRTWDQRMVSDDLKYTRRNPRDPTMSRTGRATRRRISPMSSHAQTTM